MNNVAMQLELNLDLIELNSMHGIKFSNSIQQLD